MKFNLQRQVAIIEQLAERWPQCFVLVQARRHPLKVGIYDDIVAQLDAALPGVTPDELKQALGHYVHNPVYRSKLTLGAERIDLDGVAVGTVTEAQVVHNQQKQIAAARKRKQQAQKTIAAPPPPRPAGDGFAALRAAAQRRKENAGETA